MSESRGAASVTLDTIIARVLAEHQHNYPNDYGHEARVVKTAEAVTDALLAKGRIVFQDYNTSPALVIPLEAS